MNIYSFINSKDVAAHCRNIGKTWNTLEMAIIIAKSKRRPKTKRTALQHLIDNHPDMPVPPMCTPEAWANIKSKHPQNADFPVESPPVKINDKVFANTHDLIAEMINSKEAIDEFYTFYVDIPTPFKHGDILMLGYKEPIIFVLDSLDTDNPEQLKRSLGSSGYSNYTTEGWGFFVSEAGILYGDHVCMNDTFEYYHGELSGNNRLLHYVSLFLKDKIRLPELLTMQCRIMLEQQLEYNLHFQNHGCYIDDELLLESDRNEDILMNERFIMWNGEKHQVFNSEEDRNNPDIRLTKSDIQKLRMYAKRRKAAAIQEQSEEGVVDDAHVMMDKSIEYQKGYEIMIAEGWTPEDILELGDSKVVSAYHMAEYIAGRKEHTHSYCITDENGLLVRVLEYESFMGESYESACERIPNKIQQLISEDAKNRGIDYTPTDESEIIIEYSRVHGMDSALYDKVCELARTYADYIAERKALGL